MLNTNKSHPKAGANVRALSDDMIASDETSECDSNSNLTDLVLVKSSDKGCDNVNRGHLTSAGRRGLVHSVSIIVESAGTADDESDMDENDDKLHLTTAPTERRKTIAGPIVVYEDFYFDEPKKVKKYDDIVQDVFASARLRKEEFARLLEEHAQIVREINRAEHNLI